MKGYGLGSEFRVCCNGIWRGGGPSKLSIFPKGIGTLGNCKRIPF